MGQTSRTNLFIRNVIGSALLQIVTIVTGFISPKLMLEAFGSEINGVVSSITQFISYIALVEAGLANAVVFALYKPLADRDNEARDSIVSAAKISYNRIGILFVCLSIGLAIIFPFIGETDTLSYMELSVLVLVLCLQTALNFFVLARYRAILTADQCGYLISLVSGIQLVVHLAIIYVAIQFGFNVIWVRGLGLLSLLLTSLLLALILRKKYGKINFNASPNMKALDKRWDAMLLQIMGVIQNGAPVIIMTKMLDFKIISVYTIYNMIAGSVSQCITVFTSGLGASFGNVYAIGDQTLLKKTTEEFRTAYYFLLAVLYSTMMATIIPFIAIYTEGITDTNYILPMLGIFITLKGLTANLSAPFGMLVFSAGKFRVMRRLNIVKSIGIIVLGVVFAWVWGLYGLMVVICISSVYELVEMLIITPRHLVEMSLWKTIFQIVRTCLIMGAVYCVTLKIAYVPTNYLEWFIYAAIHLLCTAALTFVVFFVFDRKEMMALGSRFIRTIKRTRQ